MTMSASAGIFWHFYIDDLLGTLSSVGAETVVSIFSQPGTMIANVYHVLFQNYSDSLQIVMTVSTCFLSLLLLYYISLVAAVFFVITHIFVTILCPAWLINLQSYKQ